MDSSFKKFGSSHLGGDDRVQELKDVLKGKKDQAAEAPSPEAAAPNAALETRIAELEEQAKSEKERALRTLAEFENFRKRMEREKDENMRYANEKVLKEILPIYDNLEMTLQHSSQEKNALVEGIELVAKEFLRTLERCGLTTVTGEGGPFDPNRHEAIGSVASDLPAGHVVTVHRKGFLLNGRLLRPAMVTVAAAPSQEPTVH